MSGAKNNFVFAHNVYCDAEGCPMGLHLTAILWLPVPTQYWTESTPQSWRRCHHTFPTHHWADLVPLTPTGVSLNRTTQSGPLGAPPGDPLGEGLSRGTRGTAEPQI